MPRRTRNLRSSPERYAWQRVQSRFIDDPQGAMRHYRALFDEVDEESADAPLSRDPAAADASAPARR
jgi:hypothetical protein